MTNNRPEGIRGACTEREDKAVDISQLSARNTNRGRPKRRSLPAAGTHFQLISFDFYRLRIATKRFRGERFDDVSTTRLSLATTLKNLELGCKYLNTRLFTDFHF